MSIEGRHPKSPRSGGAQCALRGHHTGARRLAPVALNLPANRNSRLSRWNRGNGTDLSGRSNMCIVRRCLKFLSPSGAACMPFAPAERYVYRRTTPKIPALRRSAMCITGASYRCPTPSPGCFESPGKSEFSPIPMESGERNRFIGAEQHVYSPTVPQVFKPQRGGMYAFRSGGAICL
jgi:hypothetical protein